MIIYNNNNDKPYKFISNSKSNKYWFNVAVVNSVNS